MSCRRTRLRMRVFRCLLNPSPGIRLVISHDSLPQNPIKQIGIVEVGLPEVKALGCICPPFTIVWRFDGSGDIAVPGLRHSGTETAEQYRFVFSEPPTDETPTDRKQLADPAIFRLGRADFYGGEKFPKY
jgi:hypothetical protein